MEGLTHDRIRSHTGAVRKNPCANAGIHTWDHLRTANPIESVFATVRQRTVRTKGAVAEHGTADGD
jgi:hypothetical protein